MGITTDFIGHVAVNPPFNDAEQQYLAAFAASRRFDRAGGPYAVPFNPAAEDDHADVPIDRINRVAEGQPSLWCQWLPSWSGHVLAHDGGEKFYGASRWMQYLIDHFLAPDAVASRSGLTWFADFTFDHTLDGMVAAYPRDTGELYLIAVDDNVVSQLLVAGASLPTVDRPPLPYQQIQDEMRTRRRRRPKAR